jgi:hypothetical protein
VLLVWNRLIFPNGRSIVLERQPGADAEGYAGLEDGVDYHWGELFKAAALSTLLSVGAEAGSSGQESDIARALRNGASNSINQTGQQIVQRQLNIAPTLTIRPGFPFASSSRATLFSNPTEADMAKLKLGPIADDKPVKVTVELPAGLHRDLTYAEILGRETGQPATDPVRLIVPMLERFMRQIEASRRRSLGRPGTLSAALIAGPGEAQKPPHAGLSFLRDHTALKGKPHRRSADRHTGKLRPVAASLTTVSPRPRRPSTREHRAQRFGVDIRMWPRSARRWTDSRNLWPRRPSLTMKVSPADRANGVLLPQAVVGRQDGKHPFRPKRFGFAVRPSPVPVMKATSS